MRFVMIISILMISWSSLAHEWTPTYPELRPSYVEGILTTKMNIFNGRKGIRYYQISVWDKDWNSVKFATESKIVQVNYLQRKSINVYIREQDVEKAVYICSRSKILSNDEKATVLSSRICSKVKG